MTAGPSARLRAARFAFVTAALAHLSALAALLTASLRFSGLLTLASRSAAALARLPRLIRRGLIAAALTAAALARTALLITLIALVLIVSHLELHF